MADINWRDISGMPDHLKDGRDVLLHYDLGNLSTGHPRAIIGWWHSKYKVWVWQGRAVRAYSDVYQPTHYAEINRPS